MAVRQISAGDPYNGGRWDFPDQETHAVKPNFAENYGYKLLELSLPRIQV